MTTFSTLYLVGGLYLFYFIFSFRYLMKMFGCTREAAIDHLRTARPCVGPNDAFLAQLDLWEQDSRASGTATELLGWPGMISFGLVHSVSPVSLSVFLSLSLSLFLFGGRTESKAHAREKVDSDAAAPAVGPGG